MDIRKPLEKALQALQAERARIDRQIDTLRALMGEATDRRGGRQAGSEKPRRGPGRRRMSAAARRAASKRMKEFWAKRRANAAKKKKAA